MKEKLTELLESFIATDEFDYIPERDIPAIVTAIIKLIAENKDEY